MPISNDNFFAFGNCSWKDAKIFFICDSNHLLTQLLDRRLNFAVEHILKDNGGVFLFEGETHEPKNSSMILANNKIKFNGWENQKTMLKLASLANESDETNLKK
ncbi:MAG: hypothetical protein H0T62_09795 [Parachlamydiaceae bacterium]|nr:hypothetical protein [Parachlamydiaceae bacterium]